MSRSAFQEISHETADWADPWQGLITGCCEHSIEPVSSYTEEMFRLRYGQLFKEGTALRR